MKRTLFVLDADYVEMDGETVVRLFGVDTKGNSICTIDSFDPYLYAVPDEITEELKERIEGIEEPPVKGVEVVERKLGREEREVLKIKTEDPPDVSNLRDVIKGWEEIEKDSVYEYSINFYKRYLIDRGVRPGRWMEAEGRELTEETGWDFHRVIELEETGDSDYGRNPKIDTLAFDLEVYDEGGESEIVMVSFYGEDFRRVVTFQDADYDSYVEMVENEEELIEEIVETIDDRDPDVLVTYNGDEFDFSVLRERAEEYGIDLSVSRDEQAMKFKRRMRVSSARLYGRVHLDLYRFVQGVLSYHLDTEVYTLDEVAAEVLGDQKIELQYEEILEAWRKGRDLERMAEYNLRDSELTHRLADHFIPQVLKLCGVVGQPPFDVSRMSYSQLVEWYLMRRAGELGYIPPNQPKYEEIQERRRRGTFEGGFVKEPIVGMHEEIGVMDFRSLYPTIIASHNISPETIDCSCCEGDGHDVPGSDHYFCEEEEGFYSVAVRDLIEERMEIKEELEEVSGDSARYRDLELEELAVKMVTNASYGALAYTGAKWYCYECAEASAALGRHYIQETLKEAEAFGFTVIYADTDSCFVKMGKKDIREKTEEFMEEINRELPEIMSLDLEGIYERGVFIPKSSGGTAKKRYALIDSEGSLVIKGLETVRRDWCQLAKDVQRRVIRYVLEENDKAAAIEYMHDVLERVRDKDVELKELTIYESLGKPLDEYKSKSPHVEAAKKLREEDLPYGQGMVVMYVITEGEGGISDRAVPLELAEPDEIDPEYYINNQIVPAGLRVLQVLGVLEDELKGLGKQETIREFTS